MGEKNPTNLTQNPLPKNKGKKANPKKEKKGEGCSEPPATWRRASPGTLRSRHAKL